MLLYYCKTGDNRVLPLIQEPVIFVECHHVVLVDVDVADLPAADDHLGGNRLVIFGEHHHVVLLPFLIPT